VIYLKATLMLVNGAFFVGREGDLEGRGSYLSTISALVEQSNEVHGFQPKIFSSGNRAESKMEIYQSPVKATAHPGNGKSKLSPQNSVHVHKKGRNNMQLQPTSSSGSESSE
jgi:hypothetical protein